MDNDIGEKINTDTIPDDDVQLQSYGYPGQLRCG